jgi:hypothetical protein
MSVCLSRLKLHSGHSGFGQILPFRYAPIIAIFGQNGHSQKLPFENEYLTVSAPMDTRR